MWYLLCVGLHKLLDAKKLVEKHILKNVSRCQKDLNKMNSFYVADYFDGLILKGKKFWHVKLHMISC